jgi:hypothetical protein
MESEEEALIVSLRLAGGDFGSSEEQAEIGALAERLMDAVANAGQFDGSESGEGTCTLYFYGPSAEQLGHIVIPMVAAHRCEPGSYATKRYGGPGAREVRIELG